MSRDLVVFFPLTEIHPAGAPHHTAMNAGSPVPPAVVSNPPKLAVAKHAFKIKINTGIVQTCVKAAAGPYGCIPPRAKSRQVSRCLVHIAVPSCL